MRILYVTFFFSIVFCAHVGYGQDVILPKSLKNEVGLDGEFDKSIISVYYLRYLDVNNKYAVFGQVGGPLTVNAHKNYALSVGGMWHLKPTGKSVTIGLKFYYEKINQQGEFFDGVGLEYYSKDGYELTIAPELGYTLLVNDKIRIYPYIVPFAYSHIGGTDTRTFNYNSEKHVSELSDKQSTISQSLGVKVGIRF
jgi:hypothetical protein